MKNLDSGIQNALNKTIKNKVDILFSYSFRFDTRDLLPILSHPADKNKVRVYWDQPSEGFSFAGLGSVFEASSFKYKSLEDIRNIINSTMKSSVSISDNSLIGPKIIGGHSFASYSGFDTTWNDFPRKYFVLPECLGTSSDDGTWLTISRMISAAEDLNNIKNEFIKTVDFYQNRLPVTLPPISRVAVDRYRAIPSKSEYKSTLLSILEKIKPNYLEKVVLSRSHHVKVGKGFSVISAMQLLRNTYSKCTNFFFALPDKGIFFGSTPERLIKLKNHNLQTEALAGTIARGKNMEEDRIFRESLFQSTKERKEHDLVKEQIIRKLEPFASEINVSDYPKVLKLKNVQHLHTPINIELKSNISILDIVKILHPTAAVAGAPTEKAIEIIKKMETHDRGWYSGPIGWINRNGDGEFYVSLRSAFVKNEEAHVFAGGGIVSESHPDKEWEETELKLRPIISALSGGQI